MYIAFQSTLYKILRNLPSDDLLGYAIIFHAEFVYEFVFQPVHDIDTLSSKSEAVYLYTYNDELSLPLHSEDRTVCINRYKANFLKKLGNCFIPEPSNLFQFIKTFQYLTDQAFSHNVFLKNFHINWLLVLIECGLQVYINQVHLNEYHS